MGKSGSKAKLMKEALLLLQFHMKKERSRI